MRTGKETRGRRKESAVKPSFREPGRTSGNDGEMRLVTTRTGPKLKVKYQSKWWQLDLADPAKDNVDNFIPRVWIHRGICPAVGEGSYGTEAGGRVFLPKYITTGNIVGLFFGPALGADIYTFWWMGGDSFTSGTIANGANRLYQSMVHYEKKSHSIRVEIDANGASIAGSEYVMSVFYKP